MKASLAAQTSMREKVTAPTSHGTQVLRSPWLLSARRSPTTSSISTPTLQMFTARSSGYHSAAVSCATCPRHQRRSGARRRAQRRLLDTGKASIRPDQAWWKYWPEASARCLEAASSASVAM